MWLEIFAGLLGLLVLTYLYFQKKYQYWTNKGIVQIEPTFPLGSLPDWVTKKKSIYDKLLEHEQVTKGTPYYGLYFLNNKVLMVRDPDMIRQVLIKDFDHFVGNYQVRFFCS